MSLTDILEVRGRTTQSPECSAGLLKIEVTTAATFRDAGTRLLPTQLMFCGELSFSFDEVIMPLILGW